MALIRTNKDEQQVTTRDPFRWMKEWFRWDPFREIEPSFFGPGYEPVFAPAFDVKETKDAYEFKADLPGMKEKDVEVNLTGNRLTISGMRESEKRDEKDRYYTYERSYGTFQRTFALPDGVDVEHVAAKLFEGVLTVVIPKKPAAQTKKIEIKPVDAPKS